jgi:hypothetical protein
MGRQNGLLSRDSPGEFLASAAEVTNLLAIRLRYRICFGSFAVARRDEMTPAPRPRGAGRPSTVEQYAPQVTQWLRDGPNISGSEILQRLRRAGYRGGKSSLYELVRRLRVSAHR